MVALMRRRPVEALQAGPVVPERLRVCVVEDWVDPAEVCTLGPPWPLYPGADVEVHALLAHRRARHEWCVEHGISPRERKDMFVGGRPVWRARAGSAMEDWWPAR